MALVPIFESSVVPTLRSHELHSALLPTFASARHVLPAGALVCWSAHEDCRSFVQIPRTRFRTKRRQRFSANPAGLERALEETRDNSIESRSYGAGLQMLQEEGAPVPKESKEKVYAGARKAAKKIFHSRLKGTEIMEAAGAAGLQVGVRTMNVLIHELGNLNDYESAVETFKAFREASVQPNHIVCTTLIFVLGKGHRLPEALQLFNWGLHHLPDPPPDFFHTFIIACAKCRNPNAACKAFDELQRRGLKPGRVARMGVVSALLSGGQPEEAQVWLGRMREEEIALGPVDYEAMLAACARARRAGDASAIFDNMLKQGLEPTPVSYNALLSVYERCGRWRDALRLLLKIERPNDVAWCTALSACAKAGKARVAAEVLGRMQASGRRPCVVAWSCLVEAHRRSGDWRGAEAAVEKMMAAGVAPNEVTWGSLLTCYAAAGETDKAVGVVDRATRAGVVLWTAAIVAAGEPERASALFCRMLASGCKPNVVTFSALIKAYGDAGEWRRAEEVFQDMLRARVRPNAIACASLLRAYAKGQQLGRAGTLFRHMSRLYGVQPDKYAYTALVRACALCRDWERAEAVFQHMQAAGIVPDGVLYQEMLRAYEAQGQTERAIHMMDAMASNLS